jgi:hypothetical protein
VPGTWFSRSTAPASIVFGRSGLHDVPVIEEERSSQCAGTFRARHISSAGHFLAHSAGT